MLGNLAQQIVAQYVDDMSSIVKGHEDMVRTMIKVLKHLIIITLFNWVSTLGGAGNKLDSYRNYTMFTLTIEHCIDKIQAENLEWSNALSLLERSSW